ncbi:MAG: T9SS type A sorting domain-containing protein [Bacteroidota bacterium]
MKKILLLICVFGLANNTFAQEPELLETDWYIDYFTLDDVTYNNPIVNAVGIINSNMGFETDYAYAVMDPESDSFFADVVYDPVDPAFTFINMGITLPGCNAWCDFANKYFELLIDDFIEAHFTYEIITNSDNTLTLIMTRDDGNFAVFQDSKILGINDNTLSKVRLFPNPTSDLLFISSEQAIVDTITIFDLSGKRIPLTLSADRSVDISAIPEGMYFMEITSENDRIVQKFIKN